MLTELSDFRELAGSRNKCEFWLDINDFLPLYNYNIYRKDRSGRRGGGVLLAVKSHLTCFCRRDLESDVKMLACKQTLQKHVPRLMTSLLMSSPPISILHRLFLCRYSNFGDVVASSPSFSCSTKRVLRRACSWARPYAWSITNY